MESNPHLINTNHIILYYIPIIVWIVPLKLFTPKQLLWEHLFL